MYIQASGQYYLDNARLMGSEIEPEEQTDYCWTFYYHMFGDQMGTLNVLIDYVSLFVYLTM